MDSRFSSRCRPLGPRLAAVGLAATETLADLLQLQPGLRPRHHRQPIARPGQRPFAQPGPGVAVAMLATPETAPAPLFGSAHQFRPQGIRFHVPHDMVKGFVGLDRERLVAPLIDVPFAHLAAMHLPIADMRDRKLLHERGQFAVVLRPDHEVPMIGHQQIGADAQGAGFERFFDSPLEGFVIPGLRNSCIRPTPLLRT